jgi:hypothetical protein
VKIEEQVGAVQATAEHSDHGGLSVAKCSICSKLSIRLTVAGDGGEIEPMTIYLVGRSKRCER